MHAIRIATPILLTVAVALSGCATKPGGSSPDIKVELDPVTCVFTGGSDGAGNVVVTGRTGKKNIKLKLTKEKDYTITNVTFGGTGAGQMGSSPKGPSKEKTIANSNTGPADVKYSVEVINDDTRKITNCDPKIVNN